MAKVTCLNIEPATKCYLLIFESDMNIIITGASRGLGKAIAASFASKGHHLLLNSVNEQKLAETAQALSAEYSNARIDFYAANLSDKQQNHAFANWCLSKGTPHVLVNNAGRFKPGSVYSEPADTLQEMLDDNLFSAYYLTQKIAPAMISNRSGHIFNMCSIASLHAYHNGGPYSVSKFALAGFSKNLREELKPFSIKVTAVYPGATFTDSWAGSGVSPDRIIEANDIAAMIYSAHALSPSACVEDIILRPTAGDL